MTEFLNPQSEIRDPQSEGGTQHVSSRGFDRIEFYFSANPGESPKPLAKVASGGEASRLMLILKTTSKTRDLEKSAVFDEIDAGIGGRVAEAVGVKLKQLARSQQVLCVTHQASGRFACRQAFRCRKKPRPNPDDDRDPRAYCRRAGRRDRPYAGR